MLFRVACGPRRGYGHLVRARRLAAALDATVWISVLGDAPSMPRAGRVRQVRGGPALLDVLVPDLVVLDTPVLADARRWLRAARRRSVPIASVHDAGIAPVASDLAIDASLASSGPIPGARRTLRGPAYMVVDPAVRRRPRGGTRAGVVVIALGGGPRLGLARRIARALLAQCPHLRVRIAAGFAGGRDRRDGRIELLGARRSLASTLAGARVAIVAGGITLYEAAALGVPAVAIPVVPGQRGTVRAFSNAGAAVPVSDARTVRMASPARIAAAAAALCRSARLSARLTARGRRLVDGRGVERVAAALNRLAEVTA